MTLSLTNHIGVTVPDIEAAFAWYRDVLGLVPYVAPIEVVADGSHFGELVKDLYGTSLERVRMAHLGTADGIGLELFQFDVPATEVPPDTFAFWRTGIYHVGLTVDDVTRTAAEIVAAGGARLSQVWRLFDDKDYEIVYCQDPWGTVLELCNRSYTAVWSNHDGVGPARRRDA